MNIESLNRDQLKAELTKMKVEFTSKDNTGRLKSKLKSALSSTTTTKSSKSTIGKIVTKVQKVMNNLPVVNFKQVGRNINVVINNKTYSLTIADQTEREQVKDMLKQYNNKPTQALYKKIEKQFISTTKEANTVDKTMVEKKKTVESLDTKVKDALSTIKDPEVRKALEQSYKEKAKSSTPSTYSGTTSRRRGEY